MSKILPCLEDSFVRDGQYKNDNYNGAFLAVKKDKNIGWNRKALIKFDVPKLFLHHKCFLYLYINNLGKFDSRTLTLRTLYDNDWDENVVVWDTLNQDGPNLSIAFTINNSQLGSWLKLDVSQFIISEGFTTFILENNGVPSSESYVDLGSKEQINAPYLERLISSKTFLTPAPTSSPTHYPSQSSSQSPSQTLSQKPSMKNTNFCGFTWREAAQCDARPCPSGSSIQCPIGQACYGGINSCLPQNTNFCGPPGFLWTEAQKCLHACPRGLNSECPFGQLCYGNINICNYDVPTI